MYLKLGEQEADRSHRAVSTDISAVECVNVEPDHRKLSCSEYARQIKTMDQMLNHLTVRAGYGEVTAYSEQGDDWPQTYLAAGARQIGFGLSRILREPTWLASARLAKSSAIVKTCLKIAEDHAPAPKEDDDHDESSDLDDDPTKGAIKVSELFKRTVKDADADVLDLLKDVDYTIEDVPENDGPEADEMFIEMAKHIIAKKGLRTATVCEYISVGRNGMTGD